ncbi:MAG: hypothetical protein KDH96_06790, partial [Candidatus Riesia sp.]|nr:hypothetical protein [Candidatus Riesia sp.]
MNINTTGYLNGSNTESNNYNIIPSNNITMKGVNSTVLAIKLDKDGKPMGMKFMKPNKDYKFDDADSVLEIPKFQMGGMNIQNIPIIPPVDSSIEGVQQGFVTPEIQPELSQEELFNKVVSENFPDFYKPKREPVKKNPNVSEYERNFQNIVDQMFPDYYAPEDHTGEAQAQAISTQNPTEVATVSNPSNSTTVQNQSEQPISNQQQSNEATFIPRERNNIQFFNPYGGLDIPTAANVLGESIENKDALGITFSSLKLATGLGRNILGGLGRQKRSNQTMKDYYSNMNKPMEQYLQMGGNINIEDYDNLGYLAEADVNSINEATGIT